MTQIFVHCGLHKTGTTALQTVLMRKAAVLAQNGILYPRTGRLDVLGGGHHNIAWQIARDRRFDPNLGTVEALVEEIKGFDGKIVLSSEDFESILGNRSLIDRFFSAFAGANPDVHFVIYLRNQMSYCESIFIENLSQNIGEEYPRYVHDIIRNGYLGLKDWSFQFDYAGMLKLAGASPARLIVRNFHEAETGLLANFLDALQIDPALFEDSFEFRSNERLPTVQALRMFCRNRLGRSLGEREVQAVKIVNDLIGERRLRSTAATLAAFRDTFTGGNLEICLQYDLPPHGLDMNTHASFGEDVLNYEAIFSFELQHLVAAMRNLIIDGKLDEATTLAERFIRDATAAAGGARY